MLPKKKLGPFCRASTLSGTQFQGQFFIAILPCLSFLLISPEIDFKNKSHFLYFLHVAKPCKTALTADGDELGLGKYFWAKLTPQVASEKQV